jgi:uncharacterized protein YggE
MAADEQDNAVASPTVTVRGEAAIRTEPDEAVVWITLSALEKSPGPALADVARRTDGLVALLDELGISRAHRTTTGVRVAEDFDHTPQGRRSLGHRAVGGVLVRLTDMGLIGRIVMRATDELDARVDGPNWRVSPTNPVWLEAATQASANAKARAAAYAAGIDAKLGSLISLSEPEHGYRGMIQPLSRAAAKGPEMHIDVGEQEVTATIQATFLLEVA